MAVIVGMAIINLPCGSRPSRCSPAWSCHARLLRWLSFIPISVMGALVASEVLRPGNESQPRSRTRPLRRSVTMLVFRFTRSFLGATLAGMAAFVALRALLG